MGKRDLDEVAETLNELSGKKKEKHNDDQLPLSAFEKEIIENNVEGKTWNSDD